MSNRILCKFFAHGACLKGEHCEFAHDWKNPSNNICSFYQRGACSYGSRCRYEHVRPSRPQPSASSSSSNSRQSVSSESVSLAHTTTSASSGLQELSASSKPFFPPAKSSWKLEPEHHDVVVDDDVLEARVIRPADISICSFAAAGDCPRGEKCPHLHGDLCPICGKHCLHPYRANEKEEHLKTCEKKQKQLKAFKDSQEIECCVCLDRVLSKATAAERKFGLLSECDHPFCISCIRNWRSSSPTSGMDVHTALRACPICRKVSYFVIPSVIWYSSKEEKQEIVDNYKAKLRSIDCKHFEFGNGNCPFGNSCFYKHTVKPGSYTWVHHRPPPSRRRSRRPNYRDMDALLNMIDLYMFESLREENEDELELDLLDPEDFFDDDDDLTPDESAFLLSQLGIGTDYSSDESDEEA